MIISELPMIPAPHIHTHKSQKETTYVSRPQRSALPGLRHWHFQCSRGSWLVASLDPWWRRRRKDSGNEKWRRLAPNQSIPATATSLRLMTVEEEDMQNVTEQITTWTIVRFRPSESNHIREDCAKRTSSSKWTSFHHALSNYP
nr:hypothetical protein CFP56_55981 [Quercus suber]